MRDDGVSVLATIHALEGNERTVAQLLRRYGDHVRADPGTVLFSVSRDKSDSRRFIVYETYRDESSFEAHLGSAESAEFNRVLRTLVVGGESQLTFLVSVEDLDHEQF